MNPLSIQWRTSCLLPRLNILTLVWFAGMLGGERLGATPMWPQFRGLNSQGVDDHSQPPVVFGSQTNLLWKVEVPPGVSSPCLWDQYIFLTAHEAGKLSTLGVDRRDGKILWRQPAPTDQVEEVHKASNPASASPVTDGQRVYVYFASFGLIAYDFKGREQWQKPLPPPFVVNGSGTSPALCNGRLILNCDQQGGKSLLLAIEPRTGKTLWQVPRPDFPSSYTTPVLWKHDGAEELVVAGSLRVVGYGLTDGKEHWSARGLEAVSVCPTPALGDGQLYVMSRSLGEGGSKLPGFADLLGMMDKNGDGKIATEEAVGPLRQDGAFEFIDRDRDGFITAAEWAESEKFIGKGEPGIFALRAPGTGDVTATHVAWKQKRAVAPVSSPLFYRSRVYVVQDGGRVTCYNAMTGEKAFEQERLEAEGEYFASPVAAQGNIYFASTRGTVTTIAASDTLKVIARNELGEPIMATPAIADSRIYVRTSGHLWAFGH